MIRPLFRLAVTLALLTPPALAQDCSGEQTQIAINECVYSAWQVADAELNSVYKEVIGALRAQDAQLDPALQGGAEALKQAQRAWITFRDKTCEAEGFAMRGGSGEPMVVGFCLTRLTRERIAHLYGMLQE